MFVPIKAPRYHGKRKSNSANSPPGSAPGNSFKLLRHSAGPASNRRCFSVRRFKIAFVFHIALFTLAFASFLAFASLFLALMWPALSERIRSALRALVGVTEGVPHHVSDAVAAGELASVEAVGVLGVARKRRLERGRHSEQRGEAPKVRQAP